MKKTISLALIIVLVCELLMADGAFEVRSSAANGDFSKVSGDVMKITKKRNAAYEDMVNGYNSFAMKALKEAIKGEKSDKNVMISAASLMFAIDMAASGAQGKTYKEMAKLIFPNATKRDLVSFAVNYRKMLEKSGLMKIANSIFINSDNLNENNVKVNEEYLNFLRKYFTAASDSLPFDDNAKELINKWISDHTDGMINDFFDKLDPSTIMLLINAMAFEGKWKKEYTASHIDEDGVFTNSKGEKEKAKMLSSDEQWYLSSDTAEGFLKYYEGDKYAFMAMLPNDSTVSIKDFAESLSDDAFEKFFASRQSVEVETLTPAFTFDYDISMKKMLKNMGMKKAFTKSANFFKMLDPATINPKLYIYIGDVIQKTHIELDEKGTKAAAVTVIDVKCGTTAVAPERIKKRVILDRPFMFAIMDTETGTPVFAGMVNSVQ